MYKNIFLLTFCSYISDTFTFLCWDFLLFLPKYELIIPAFISATLRCTTALIKNKVQPLLQKLQHLRDLISQGRVIKYVVIWVNWPFKGQLDKEMLLNIKKWTWFLKEHVENKERNEQDTDAIIDCTFSSIPWLIPDQFSGGIKRFFRIDCSCFLISWVRTHWRVSHGGCHPKNSICF